MYQDGFSCLYSGAVVQGVKSSGIGDRQRSTNIEIVCFAKLVTGPRRQSLICLKIHRCHGHNAVTDREVGNGRSDLYHDTCAFKLAGCILRFDSSCKDVKVFGVQACRYDLNTDVSG